MIFGERFGSLISLAGHLSTMERHEQNKINEALHGISGYDTIKLILEDLGFKFGDKIKKDQRKILRSDNTEINNAYLSGNHEGMKVIMNESFSPKKHFERSSPNSLKSLVERSKYGPGHIFDLYGDK